MKKTSLAAILMFTSISAFSQIMIIPKAGATLSTVNWSNQEGVETKSRLGLTLGFGFAIPVSESFTFQPELNYIQKGFKGEASVSETMDGDTFTLDLTTNMNIDYIEIPVLGKMTFGTDTKFFLIAGPSLGIGIGGKNKIDADVSFTSGGETETFSVSDTGKVKFGDTPENPDPESTDVYVSNRMDFGLQFGGGFLIKDKVMIDIRYGLGLTDLSEEEDSKNRVLQFTVGVPFPVK